PKPIVAQNASHMTHIVACIDSTYADSGSSELTFQYPHIPELNVEYGRKCFWRWNQVRSAPNGLDFVVTTQSFNLTVSACTVEDVFTDLFQAFGMEARRSSPGLVTSRLVQQMGGLQGCRVFKIRGVRNLIWDLDPQSSVTKSAAQQLIADLDPESR